MIIKNSELYGTNMQKRFPLYGISYHDYIKGEAHFALLPLNFIIRFTHNLHYKFLVWRWAPRKDLDLSAARQSGFDEGYGTRRKEDYERGFNDGKKETMKELDKILNPFAVRRDTAADSHELNTSETRNVNNTFKR